MQEQTPELEIRRVRHELKMRMLSVLGVSRLSPQLLRLTLTGEDLADLHSDGFDDHVKLMLPAPGVASLVFPPPGPDGKPDWEGSGLPPPVMRDYTVRRIDRTARELDIEFVLHGHGPAATWAAQARPGDSVHIGGPRGSLVVPDDLEWQWLIGDEAALPAIARRLEELGDEVIVTVVLETQAEALPPLRLGAHRRLVQLRRAAAETSTLAEAVRALPTPVGRGHAFAAAESRTVKAVREALVQHGLAGTQIRAAAYWRDGASAHHENLDGA